MTRYGWLVLLAWSACAGCQTGRLHGLSDSGDQGVAGRSGAELAEASDPSESLQSNGPTVLLQAERREPATNGAAGSPAGLLEQAAACYERGDEAQAIDHLKAYLVERPEHLIARAQLAELLFRQQRREEARLHFEVFIAEAQEHPDLAFRYLIHSHSRLVEIAEEDGDPYGERLNRGIGLYLLACRRAQEPDSSEPPTPDVLLCKAATQLQAARGAEPAEARPDWYLYRVWTRLGQQSAARRALRSADSHALLSPLTPPERRQLHAACLSDAMP